MLKYFKILSSFFLVLVFIQATSFANGYKPAQEGIATLTQWTNSCFKQLKEYQTRIVSEKQGADIPSTFLKFKEFRHVTQAFIQRMRKSSFTNDAQWISNNTPNIELFNLDRAFDYDDPIHPYVQKLVVPSGSKVCFIGDLHGSVHSLLRNLWRLVVLGYLDENFTIKKPEFYMIFNGDFVDRGRYGLEVIYTLIRLKLANWDKVHLLRGNHEDKDINERDGFFDELDAKFDLDDIKKEYKKSLLAQEKIVNQAGYKAIIALDAQKKQYADLVKQLEDLKPELKHLSDLGEQGKGLRQAARKAKKNKAQALKSLKEKENTPAVQQFNVQLMQKMHNPYDFVWRFFEMLPFALFLGSGEGEGLSFVQCCHGGVEPGYDPKPLLASDKVFDAISSVISQAATAESPYYEDEKTNNYAGFNWSDFAQGYSDNKEIQKIVRQNVLDHVQEKRLSIEDIEVDSFIKKGFEMLRGNIIWNVSRGAGYIADIVSTFRYLQKNNLRAFFRGHQDQLFGLKMFFNDELMYQEKFESDPFFKQEHNYNCGPYNWRRVASPEDQESPNGFQIAKYVPVFTFTSATEGQVVPYDCFGILTTAASYDDWLLKPYEVNLEPAGKKGQRHEKYVALDVTKPDSDDVITINFVDDPQQAGVTQGLSAPEAAPINIEIE